MKEFSIEEVMSDMDHNWKLAQQFPEKQKEFHDEYMYSNPNDLEEMIKLHADYGYKYSLSLWAYQQAMYMYAGKLTEERLKNEIH